MRAPAAIPAKEHLPMNTTMEEIEKLAKAYAAAADHGLAERSGSVLH